jgi:hypothetical protein
VGEELAQGYFSLLRWRSDATRDEARNVAVLLVDASGHFAGIRHAPLSTISPRVHDQGIMDEVLLGLEERFASEGGVTLEELRELHALLQRALVVTEPRPVDVAEPEQALSDLYRAYVAPRVGGSRAPTKGAVLDRVMDTLRGRGVRARRAVYVDDFIFDVVVDNGGRPSVFEVLSFAVGRKDWTPVERDAGHFLYALRRVDVEGRAVVQPPSEGESVDAYERVRRWFELDAVPTLALEELEDTQLELELVGHR